MTSRGIEAYGLLLAEGERGDSTEERAGAARAVEYLLTEGAIELVERAQICFVLSIDARHMKTLRGPSGFRKFCGHQKHYLRESRKMLLH